MKRELHFEVALMRMSLFLVHLLSYFPVIPMKNPPIQSDKKKERKRRKKWKALLWIYQSIFIEIAFKIKSKRSIKEERITLRFLYLSFITRYLHATKSVFFFSLSRIEKLFGFFSFSKEGTTRKKSVAWGEESEKEK